MDNSKYYFVKRKGDQAYPIINLLNLGDVECGNSEILYAVIGGSTIPRNPVMADFLKSANDIFTQRIADVMQEMDMENVYFYPTHIDDTKGKIHDNYVCIDVADNTYELLDKELSNYFYENLCYSISKLVINRKKLNEIPLNKRLGMRLREAPGYTLYHQSVVDAVMALEPTGMYFKDIEEHEVL